MKRVITLYLTDGRNITLDFYTYAPAFNIPIGANLDHPAIANMTRAFCMNGLMDPDNTDEHNFAWIGPAMISRVAVTEQISLVKS